MTFKVYQATAPAFDEEILATWPDGHVHVADVECDSLDAAFQLTNTIDFPWWMNPGVTPSEQASHGCRSTSVGDVIVDPQGVAHGVLAIGFKELP